MAPVTRVPVQVHLYPHQLEGLQSIADRWHVSVEDLIRQSVALLLETLNRRENPQAQVPLEDDPWRSFVGMGDSGVSDLAENHDKYLMEFEDKSNRSGPAQSS